MVSLKRMAEIVGFSQDPLDRLAQIRQEIARLTAEETELVQTLRGSIHFEQILPDTDKASTALHRQLFENERVHPVESVQELIAKRIGREGDNKRCFARVIPNGQPTVSAGICTALVNVPTNNGEVDYGQIPGNIEQIRDMDIAEFTPPERGEGTTVAVLYTISSSSKHEWERGGRPLANSTYKFLHAEAAQRGHPLIISTLSPVRKINDWLKDQDCLADLFAGPRDDFMAFLEDAGNRQAISAKVMEYLITEQDPVLNFHLGNGAYIGDLKYNSGNTEDWVMVNYVYPSDVGMLEENKAAYKATKVRAIAPHLQVHLGRDASLKSQVNCVIYPEGRSLTGLPVPAAPPPVLES